jgi:hypothetical protein
MRRGRALESFQVGEALGDSRDLVFTRIRRICDRRQIVAHLFIKGRTRAVLRRSCFP